ncbi:MAG: type V CRISPR-associated protein Cas4 [Bacteroidales bacterium]|nr:type V CRISPR-associated protein Cas4 [Bacteroidales bacterium]
MDDYIAIATLNDFIFCPYSIYLHSVYMETDEGLYKAPPQTKGTIVHEGVDKKSGSTRSHDIFSLPVFSDSLGIAGKIDLFKQDRKLLIERKNNLKQIFRGQLYQIWAQYFCMKEMEYDVQNLAFYEISTNKMFPIKLPSNADRAELANFIDKFKKYNPLIDTFNINPNKCRHCIYCNLCDKTSVDNVYT